MYIYYRAAFIVAICEKSSSC